jgi:hypothetical protein
VGTGVPPRLACSEGDECSNSTWKRVEALIRSLDGAHRTDVFVGDPEAQRFLAVSGGNGGRYAIGVQESDAWYYLVDPQQGGPDVVVVTGGLPDCYPPAEVHTLDTALRAARYYFDTGERAPQFDWRRGGPVETGLIHEKLEESGEIGRIVDSASRVIGEANQASEAAHREILHALFRAVFGECDRVVTSEELREAGFDDSKEPDIVN